MIRKRINLLFMILVVVGVLVGCAEKEKETDDLVIRLGYPIAGIDFIGGVAGIAKEQGYFEEELKGLGYVIEYTGFAGAGPAVNEALASGKLDLAIYADFPGIVLTSKGIDLSLISITDSGFHAGIVVAKDSSIETITDLKGKKIAFPKGTYVQKYLVQAFEAYGIKEGDVELVNMTADAESALLSGSVDAVAFTESFVARLAFGEAEGKIIHTSRENSEWTGAAVFVGSNTFLKENEKAAVALVKALIRAKEYAQANPEAVYQLFAEKTGISLDASKYLYNLDEGKFEYYSLEVSQTGLEKLNQNKQFLLDTGLITEDFDINRWGDNSYYEKALSEVKP